MENRQIFPSEESPIFVEIAPPLNAWLKPEKTRKFYSRGAVSYVAVKHIKGARSFNEYDLIDDDYRSLTGKAQGMRPISYRLIDRKYIPYMVAEFGANIKYFVFRNIGADITSSEFVRVDHNPFWERHAYIWDYYCGGDHDERCDAINGHYNLMGCAWDAGFDQGSYRSKDREHRNRYLRWLIDSHNIGRRSDVQDRS